MTHQCEAMEETIKRYEGLKVEHEKLCKEHEELQAVQCAPKLSRKESEEVIRTRTRGRKKSINTTIDIKCESPNCLNANEGSLIKCNACHKWVCETCSDVPIQKLKPIVNKCSSIYFACAGCNSALQHSTSGKERLRNNNHVKSEAEVINNNGDVPSSSKDVRSSSKDVTAQLETKVVKMIDKNMQGKSDQSTDRGETTEQKPASSYAGALAGPDTFRKIMREARNEEKIEEFEKEQRSNNFIIHGAEEVGSNISSIQKNDEEFILDILDEIRLQGLEPKSVVRLGKPSEDRPRPIKVQMKTKAGKDKVMNSLKYLRGTEDYFGKIRITDDYTKEERDTITEWVKKAEEKSRDDTDKVYRVRGDPKNGLRLVHFPRR